MLVPGLRHTVGGGSSSLYMNSARLCTVLLDPRDPLLHSERTQGFAADPDYWKGEVFAYVGLPQNLKDLKDSTRSCASAPPCWKPLDTALV